MPLSAALVANGLSKLERRERRCDRNRDILEQLRRKGRIEEAILDQRCPGNGKTRRAVLNLNVFVRVDDLPIVRCSNALRIQRAGGGAWNQVDVACKD